MLKHKQEVLEKRSIFLKIIEVLKLLGKQGLPFRGTTEAACSLKDDTLNHGNFLEIIHLLSKYDKVLANHIYKAFELNTLQNEYYLLNKTSSKKGRGSFMTFLSANTVSKVIKEIGKQIKEMIAQDINSAK